MIEKLTDIGRLSGVSSPLLPLIYCDFYSCVNEADGVYIQTIDGEDTLLLSMRNGSVVITALADDWDRDELLSFISFTHTAYVTADFQWDEDARSFNLMVCEATKGENNTIAITSQSTLNEYRSLHALLGETGDDFDSWYISFSCRVNTNRALAVYTEAFCSCALCTAIMGDTGVIAGVYTSPRYRGKGYGKEAVTGLVSALSEAGVSNIVLWCEDKNIPFYEKSGFAQRGKIYYSEVK